MLVDANILIYAVDAGSPWHERSRRWLESAMNGASRVALPWPSLLAFLRIVTNARVVDDPLTPTVAWAIVASWLAHPRAWIPRPGPDHARILGELVTALDARGPLIPDCHLAALAVEHGLVVASADADFARFPGVRWLDPTRH